MGNQTANQPANNTALATYNQLVKLVKTEEVMSRFADALGPQRSRAFLASVLNLVATDKNLMNVEPLSVIRAAMTAALFDLPIDKNLGYAWIIPYKGVAQFQMGAKGYTQLALRSQQYAKINYFTVYEGEEVTVNKVTSDVVVTGAPASDKIKGFCSYFRLKNGYDHTLYWTDEYMTAHAKKYSKSYSNPDSKWRTEYEKMGWKTILSNNLRKFGVLSVTMLDAMKADDDMALEEILTKRHVPQEGPVASGPDIIDGEFSEPTKQPPFDPAAFLVEHGICENEHGAHNLLKNHIPDQVATDAEKLLIWGNAYREQRNQKATVEEAAMYAGTIIDLGAGEKVE